MNRKKLVIFITTLFALVVIPLSAYAIAGIDDDDPLVPCDLRTTINSAGVQTNPCTFCHFYELIHNILEFLMFIIIPLAVFSLGLAGFILLTSGTNPGRRERGKQILWTTIWGIVIAFTAWIIINFILFVLVADSGDPGDPGSWTTNPNTWPLAWNEFNCDAGTPRTTELSDRTTPTPAPVVSDECLADPTRDCDFDGFTNEYETDVLGADPALRDSDNDGIPDNVEAVGTNPALWDTDGDGTIDALDTDSDGDGKLDKEEGLRDNDCDGTPNYRDADDEEPWSCSYVSTDLPQCGDGDLHGLENCEVGDLSDSSDDLFHNGDNSCARYTGDPTGTVTCNDDCTVNVSQCGSVGNPVCGDGRLHPQESCDLSASDDPATADDDRFQRGRFCSAYFTRGSNVGGNIGCNNDCTLNFSSCHVSAVPSSSGRVFVNLDTVNQEDGRFTIQWNISGSYAFCDRAAWNLNNVSDSDATWHISGWQNIPRSGFYTTPDLSGRIFTYNMDCFPTLNRICDSNASCGNRLILRP